MSEIIPLVKGQLLDADRKPYLGPVLAESPGEVVDFLLGTQGEWWTEAEGKNKPLLTLDLVYMERQEFDNMGPWEG